ncbi:hypothetical protein FJZ53_01030 [Candidatus Woesearchaeota archaeon]|nr:hypothetical protein [Candidatus Woesearchaeota archaeon]
MLGTLVPSVWAVDLNDELTGEEKSAFDEILTPVMKIYNLVKYSASAIAAIALLFAAIGYMTSGSDPRKRDSAKNTAGYVVMGLFIIWATPYIVNFLV